MITSPVGLGTKNYWAAESRQQTSQLQCCNRHNTYKERPTSPIVEEEAPTLKTYMFRGELILGHKFGQLDSRNGCAT
jgi:hypothetical protein